VDSETISGRVLAREHRRRQGALVRAHGRARCRTVPLAVEICAHNRRHVHRPRPSKAWETARKFARKPIAGLRAVKQQARGAAEASVARAAAAVGAAREPGAAVVHEAAAGAAGAGAGADDMASNKSRIMAMKKASSPSLVSHLRAGLLAAIVALAATASARGAEQPTFNTPQAAVDGLAAAIRANNTARVASILGPGSKTLLSSGDPVADRNAYKKFIAEYDVAHDISDDGDRTANLVVGSDDWPFPFPIVKVAGRWRFDSKDGAQEIIDRRVGANELSTIEVCKAYVAAQREYAERDRDHDGWVEYAQKFLSSPGKRDGLYWPASSNEDKSPEDKSPLGPFMANARAEGYSSEAQKSARTPYHGYYYKILTGQGPEAKGGAYDYIIKGHMIGGFGVVAYPAQYKSSGIMTFIVNHDGIVYQKNLGPDTSAIASKMTLFDPDQSWTAVP
jgi:hypothetical protein